MTKNNRVLHNNNCLFNYDAYLKLNLKTNKTSRAESLSRRNVYDFSKL